MPKGCSAERVRWLGSLCKALCLKWWGTVARVVPSASLRDQERFLSSRQELSVIWGLGDTEKGTLACGGHGWLAWVAGSL